MVIRSLVFTMTEQFYKIIFLIICFGLGLNAFITEKPVNPCLTVTIYYESLCSDCIIFFKEQFDPFWRTFGDAVKWRMIPYGKARQWRDENGVWQFECQHGEQECKTNGMQASLLSLEENQTVALKFISCYMQGMNKEELGYKCGKMLNVDYDHLTQYSNSAEGRELLAALGTETHDVKPKITFIPTIVFDGVYDFDVSEKARRNLKREILERLNYE